MNNAESENLVDQISGRVREALLEAEQRGGEFVADAERRAGEIVAEAERRREEIVADAERRAGEIVAHAETEARETRARAEEQARERIDRARSALEEIGGSLGGDAGPAPSAAEPEPVVEPDPVPAPEADLQVEPEPEPTPEAPAAKPAESASGPSTEELIATLKGGPERSEGAGEEAARLVAMNMALDGASREEVDRHLAQDFDVSDRDTLLDEVFARVGR